MDRGDTMRGRVMRVFIISVIAVVAIGLSIPANGEDWNRGIFTFQFENDFVHGTDQYYTNGLKITWISPNITNDTTGNPLYRYSHSFLRHIPYEESNRSSRISVTLGQNIYMPTENLSLAQLRDDRPCAGWTYAGTAVHSTDGHTLDTWEIQLGIVGPDAFAEDTQRLIHGTQWHYELKNEPGVVLACERKWRAHEGSQTPLNYDIIPHAGITVGNVSTFVTAGCEIRAGRHIPKDFGTATIRPAGYTRIPAHAGTHPTNKHEHVGWYLFAAVDGRIVARDIFLDGNTFTDSPSVEKELCIAEVTTGIAVTMNRFTLSIAHIMRTEEFSGQESDHQFGSIFLSIPF